ncbi:MAG: glycosyltransferase [Elusimicrobiota bacterium]
MNIGFYIKWPKDLGYLKGNVIGDELYANSLIKSISKKFPDIKVDLYAPNYLPSKRLDVLIYLNDTLPIEKLAKRHVLYMQNAYAEGSDNALIRFEKIGYDGYAFISKKICDMHINKGYKGIYLPFGVDTEFFYPRPVRKEFEFEVCYVGNDIKGEYRTRKYIMPALNFNFGLFGNWKPSKYRFRFWRNFKKVPEYKKILSQVSRGKIPQEDLPFLYSSTKININCTTQDCVDWDVITLRTYEVIACKGFLITDKTETAMKLMGDCMVFTDGDDDMVEKIKYYLNNEKERKEIAERGYAYVIKNNTIDVISERLVNYIMEIY